MLQMFALKMLFSMQVFVHAFRSPPDYLRFLPQIAGSGDLSALLSVGYVGAQGQMAGIRVR